MQKVKFLISWILILSILFCISIQAGEIRASGDGTASIIGKGTVEIEAIRATLWIWSPDRWLTGNDRGISIDVSGYGTKEELAPGVYRYKGFDGKATVKGDVVFGIRVEGKDIKLHGWGDGRIYLEGKGDYWIGGKKFFGWPKGIVIIKP